MDDAEERAHPQPAELHFKNDEAHLKPSRWWFASSAFPMIASTLGPVASAFSICALSRPWLQYLPPGQDIDTAQFLPDPPWLAIVNAIQLAVAILSNVFLLLNMSRRVGFVIAQPITIVGWYISAICLLALNVAVAGPFMNHLHPADDYILAQAFYYGIWASILYFVDASLMVVTFWGASTGHYDKDFMLTPSQRTLMLQTIMLMLYLLIGALVFCNIENWNYLDAVYWADVTLFTVGFGDFTPSSSLGRALLIPYALIGIISLGLVIASIRSFLLERGKRCLDARVEEKNRRRTVRTMTLNGNDEILNPIQPPFDAASGPRQEAPSAAELERRKAEFELMRKIQKQASTRRKWIGLAISVGSWLLLWLVGAAVFVECEKPYQPWTYFDAFYFCFISFTTIGYGDLTPQSNAGKSFFVFWSLLALPTITVLISKAGDTVVMVIRDATIRVGSVTILPGDEGFTRNLKYCIHQLSCRQAFRAVVSQMRDLEAVDEEVEVGFHGPHHKNTNDNGCDPLQGERLARMQDRTTDSDVEGTTSSLSIRRAPIARLHSALDDVPSGPDFHVLLVSEIQTVTGHVRGGKRRHYTYEEWAWYLRLLGEDERNPGMHRKVGIKPKDKKHKDKKHSASKQIHHDEEGLHRKWSWVGVHSPLMGSQEESDWILDKLTARLKASLTAGRRFRARTVASGGLHGGVASAHESSHEKSV